MINIHSTWRNYFTHRNEGLGTTYERFILHRYFERIRNRFSIESLLEVPSFGMTGISGINSLWWAMQGAKVTAIDNDRERIDLVEKVWRELSLSADIYFDQGEFTTLPFLNDSFDLAWNFAAVGSVPNLREFLAELSRVSRKAIFLCIPNKTNIFRLLFPNSSKNTNIERIKKIMFKLGWLVEECGYLDVPPWPDIAMSKEDLLQSVGMVHLAKKLRGNLNSQICILDHFSKKNGGMRGEILNYSYLEDSPKMFQKIWAHHQYLVFKPHKA